MKRALGWIAAIVAATGLVAMDPAAFAQGKGKDRTEQGMQKGQKAPGAKKQHHHHDGKSLVGDKIKRDGRHEIDRNGKFTASVDVKGGKIAGMNVKHADKGDVPVKKYKTKQKMVAAPSAIQPVVYLAQSSGTEYLGQTWIGYSYIDDYGDEQIYWYPYDMILDGDTGAIEYVPAY